MTEPSNGPESRKHFAERALSLHSLFDGTPRVSERQTVIIHGGELSREVFLLKSGWACRERLLPNGRRAVLDFYLAGDTIGLDHLFLERAPDRVLAVTTIVYHALDREELHALCRRKPEVTLQIAQRLTEEKQRLDRSATRLARLPAIDRTVAALHHLSERLSAGSGKAEADSHTAFRLPLTQQLLADYIGLNLIHLNRTLRSLRVSGVLKVETGVVIIKDTNRLRQIVCTALDRT